MKDRTNTSTVKHKQDIGECSTRVQLEYYSPWRNQQPPQDSKPIQGCQSKKMDIEQQKVFAYLTHDRAWPYCLVPLSLTTAVCSRSLRRMLRICHRSRMLLRLRGLRRMSRICRGPRVLLRLGRLQTSVSGMLSPMILLFCLVVLRLRSRHTGIHCRWPSHGIQIRTYSSRIEPRC
jgi:hypothetical protein